MKNTILIADSDTVLLEILRSRCVLLGLNVETVMRGDDALRAVDVLQPDVICLQSSLLCGNGRTVWEMLSRDLKRSHTPLVVLRDGQAGRGSHESHDTAAHIIPRAGNVWHRLEPLLLELLDLAQHGTAAAASPHPHRTPPTTDTRPAKAGSVPDRALRIDEPPRKAAGRRRTVPPLAPNATLREDARDDVLDAVFAWFGSTQTPARKKTATAGLNGPHHRDRSEPPWVLCVEDDEDLSMALKLRLEGHGVAVVRAFDGRAGYRTAFTHPADAILLDYNLPQGQGDYVLRRLKENPVTADVPVIVITGVRSAATRRQMLSLGAEEFLTKPIDFTELVDVLGKYMNVLPREYSTTRCSV